VISRTSDHLHLPCRFIAFGLDLFNTAFRRGRFDFKDSQIMARLEPMAAVIGNTLYSDNGQVLIHALKAAVGVVKCPLKAIDKSLPVYIRQMLSILEHSGSTESDIAQATLKALATVIRDCPSSQIREKDLVRLLEIITPDIEETARQSSVFMMLRAIVSRKFVVPEIYDVMDKVAETVVTNQSPQVQESCRAILLQFLLDYPQGKGRLTHQMTFLAKNLSYIHESGRKSVMELLGAIISKFDSSLLYQHTDLLFIALVMVLANDESAKCREMSASLIQNLLSRLDEERRAGVLAYMRSWVDQREQPRLCSVSVQVYGLFLDAFHGEASDQQSTILATVNDLLTSFSRNVDVEGGAAELEWHVPYQSLLTASKLAREFPDVLTGVEEIAWKAVLNYLLFPHAWVRLAASRLLGQLYAIVPPSRLDSIQSKQSPFSMAESRQIAQDSCEQLKSEHLDQALSLQVVKNLFYLGKCFATSPLPPQSVAATADANEAVEEDTDTSDEEHKNGNPESHPLPWLFSRLSYQLRSSLIARRSRGTTRVSRLLFLNSIVVLYLLVEKLVPAANVHTSLVRRNGFALIKTK
jgi:U3 small nucleolar RNA-associated protein 20